MSGIKARVYSVERLEANRKQSIADGIDMVGQNLGGISIEGFSIVNIPVRNGLVNPDKVGYRNFQRDTDLHVFVAPISVAMPTNTAGVSRQQLGFSYKRTGIAWVGDKLDRKLTALTAAHETAHAFGYVLDGAPQGIRAGSPSHCSSDGCIMQPAVEQSVGSVLRGLPEGFLRDLFGINVNGAVPEDFCTPCRADMHATANENVAAMHLSRALTDGVSSRALKF